MEKGRDLLISSIGLSHQEDIPRWEEYAQKLMRDRHFCDRRKELFGAPFSYRQLVLDFGVFKVTFSNGQTDEYVDLSVSILVVCLDGNSYSWSTDDQEWRWNGDPCRVDLGQLLDEALSECESSSCHVK